ncbi:MAG: cation transporter [Firmicutes bacterium]|nr:cation transporter [Bacillota bacterium]
MKGPVNLLIEKITRGRDLAVPAERIRIGLIEGWSSILVNLLLTAIKAGVGLAIGSIALLADAAHTASDIASSAVVVIGFKISGKAPDKEHPFGHGRAEYLVGLFIAAMLIAVGLYFIVASYRRLTSEPVLRPSLAAVLITLVVILCKEFMYHFSLKLGHRINSEALIADAWHHRSDALTSVLVLIALVGNLFKISILDALFGFPVSGFLVYTGLGLFRRSTDRLLGTGPTPETRERIISSIRSVEGVLDAHDLVVHDYGTMKSISLHIEVDRNLPLPEAHAIAESVETLIKGQLPCSVVVHLDPRDAEKSG